MLVFRLVLEFLETVTNSLFRKGVHPQTFDRTFTSGLLVYPTLDELSFLTGITAVDDLVGLVDQFFDDIELFVYTGITGHLNRETRRNHRKRTKAPSLPLLRIFLRIQQRAQVAERPGDLVSVTFKIAIVLLLST